MAAFTKAGKKDAGMLLQHETQNNLECFVQNKCQQRPLVCEDTDKM